MSETWIMPLDGAVFFVRRDHAPHRSWWVWRGIVGAELEGEGVRPRSSAVARDGGETSDSDRGVCKLVATFFKTRLNNTEQNSFFIAFVSGPGNLSSMACVGAEVPFQRDLIKKETPD